MQNGERKSYILTPDWETPFCLINEDEALCRNWKKHQLPKLSLTRVPERNEEKPQHA